MSNFPGLITLLIGLLVIAISVFFFEISNGDDVSPQIFATNEFQQIYIQSLSEALAVLEDEGVSSALLFAAQNVEGAETYSIRHFVLHEIGHQAFYEASGDVSKALDFLPDHAFEREWLYVYDGYTHGVLHSYFFEEKGNKTFLELATESCAEYLAAPTMPHLRAGECFHAVGHALMYAGDNDIEISREVCSNLPYTWMEEKCLYGAFMELSYLYVPLYHSATAKPELDEDSFVAFCENFPEPSALQCAHFAGSVYRINHNGDVRGALNSCQEFISIEHQETCVDRIATFGIPPAFGEDIEGMVRECLLLPGHLHEICLDSIQGGVEIGTAGDEFKGRYKEIQSIYADLSR